MGTIDYTPDRWIVKKVKAYDPDLYLKWSKERECFELWRKRPWWEQDQLITPITRSIYKMGAPKTFVELDDRLLWWIFQADSHRVDSSHEWAKEWDTRVKAFTAKQEEMRRRDHRDMAKDMYSIASKKYYAGCQSPTKNRSEVGLMPKFNQVKPSNWARPDKKLNTSSRLFTRSALGAKRFDFKR